MADIWKFTIIATGHERKAALEAYWEVYYDPISDDYTPHEVDASELFKKWVSKVKEEYPDGLVPIYWSVRCEESGIHEFMPFQFTHFKMDHYEDFLTFFTWPVHSSSGDSLNWLTLPVVDKLWNANQANKGGFIQEATGWKPAILQPHVYLPALTSVFQSH